MCLAQTVIGNAMLPLLPLWLSLLFRCSGYAQSLCQRKAMAATVPPIIAAGFNTLMATCVWPVLTPDLRGHSINALW